MYKVEDRDGIRIDLYLVDVLNISRSKIQKLIKDDNVMVNGKVVNSSYCVKLDDLIDVKLDIKYEEDLVPENIDLDILYEDDDLIILNKKSGMVVHPGAGHFHGTLVNALLYRYPLSSGDKLRPGIVHRLDKDTSGVMLVAKNDWAHEKLADMISKKEVERKYLAITLGVINNDSGTIDAPIGRDRNNREKMCVTDINGKDSITHFKVLERFRNNTLIECKLDTGRTHQIRVHMAYIGYPILNDPLYGRGKSSEFGQMLHSYSIKFIHPRSGKELFYKVDPPIEFLEVLDKLRLNSN